MDRTNPDTTETEEPTVDLSEDRVVRCAACGATVCTDADVFAPEGQRSSHVFANPHGFVWEIVTVRRAAVVSRGPEVAEFTWFPGYSWQIVVCAACTAHLGWRYAGSGDPPEFYGLIASRVTR